MTLTSRYCLTMAREIYTNFLIISSLVHIYLLAGLREVWNWLQCKADFSDL